MPKNHRVWPTRVAHSRRSFHFQKITENEKLIFFSKICKYLPFFYFKEQSPNRKFERKKTFEFFPKMGKIVFGLVKGRHNFIWSFSSFLEFTKSKEDIPPFPSAGFFSKNSLHPSRHGCLSRHWGTFKLN